MKYKRIVFTTAGESLLTHANDSVRIRASRNAADPVGTYVIETDDWNERRKIDKLVELYDSADVE